MAVKEKSFPFIELALQRMLLLLTPLTEKIISLFAGGFIAAAQIMLVVDVFTKRFTPSLLSWLGWGLLIGTGLLSQVIEQGWEWSQIGLLLSTIGCFVIFFLSWANKNYLIVRSDWRFLFLGLICLLIYYISQDAWITTCFAILADFIVGIPTLLHAYRNPISQKSSAWMLGFISWTFSLILCAGNPWLYALFPIYLFLYNGAMVLLTAKSRVRKNNANH